MAVIQAIIVNQEVIDAGWSKGRIAAHVAHAAVAIITRKAMFLSQAVGSKVTHYFEFAFKKEQRPWYEEVFTKRVYKASLEEISNIFIRASEASVRTEKIDEDGYLTALALEPVDELQASQIIGSLKLY